MKMKRKDCVRKLWKEVVLGVRKVVLGSSVGYCPRPPAMCTSLLQNLLYEDMYINIQTNTATSCVYTETTLVKTVLLYDLTDLVYIDLFLVQVSVGLGNTY